LTVLLELEHRRGDREVLLTRRHRRQALAFADCFREILAAHRFELGLWVEEIHLGWSTRLEQVDNALRLRLEVREA
jgi:hypothetical protein